MKYFWRWTVLIWLRRLLYMIIIWPICLYVLFAFTFSLGLWEIDNFNTIDKLQKKLWDIH